MGRIGKVQQKCLVGAMFFEVFWVSTWSLSCKLTQTNVGLMGLQSLMSFGDDGLLFSKKMAKEQPKNSYNNAIV